MKRFILILVLINFAPCLSAQYYLLRYPKEYEKPQYIPGDRSYNSDKVDPSGEVTWFVIIDRNDVQAYEKPSDNSEKLRVLNYLDMAYVADAKSDWVKLVGVKDLRTGFDITITRFRVDKGQEPDEIGWVKKEDVLLWNKAPVHHNSQIHQKAFLLYKAKEIGDVLKTGDENQLTIYADPNLETAIGNESIHNFYYIYKEENGNFLLGTDYKVNPIDYKNQIIGWVDKRYCKVWKTRLALEPNFEKFAFSERQQEEDFKVRAFRYPDFAKLHGTNREVIEDEVVLSPDPAYKTDEWRGTGEGNAKRRFKGGVMRMPVFASSPDIFSTGVIGQITLETLKGNTDQIAEDTYSLILSDLQVHKQARDNFNVFFLIEGSSDMATTKPQVVEIMKTLGNNFQGTNLKFGYSVFRDVLVNDPSKVMELSPLSQNIDNTIAAFEKIQFQNYGDNDKYTALNYALKESISQAGFDKNQSNILIYVGSNPDFSLSNARLAMADDSNKDKMVSTADITDALASLNMNVLAYATENARQKLYDQNQAQWINIVEQTAQIQFNYYKQIEDHISDFKIGAPFVNEQNKLIGGSTFGGIFNPSKDNISNPISSEIALTKELINEFWGEISNVFEYGASADAIISQGKFQPSFAKLILGFIEESKGRWTIDDIQKILQKKYKLYRDAYIPKQISGADHKTYSTVLYFTEEDLEGFINDMKNIIEVIGEGSLGKQKDEFYDYFKALMGRFTGDTYVKLDDTSLEEIEMMILGISKEGYDLNKKISKSTVKDLLSLSSSEKQRLLEKLKTNRKGLQNILSQKDQYEFSFVSSNGSLYFWIPMEEAYIFSLMDND